MDDKDIRAWARHFATELKVAGEPAIFDQVVGRHLETLSLLKRSLRWKGIANILVQAGVRRDDGVSPISEDQLKASYRRMRLRLKPATRHSSDVPAAKLSRKRKPAKSQSVLARRHSQPQPSAQTSKDVSETEIQSALNRMSRQASDRKGRH